MRFPVEIVERVREAVGDDFIVIYRLSLLDLVDDAQSWDETVALAKAVEAAGATIINTGIGWHEARIPTIVTSVPRAAFAWVTGEAQGRGRRPARRVQPHQHARGRRGDPRRRARPTSCRWRGRCWPTRTSSRKAAEGRADEINTCIACNQACLDHTFDNKRASCLVNPRACHETELVLLAHPHGQAHRRRRRRPGRPRRRHRARRARPRASSCSRQQPEIGGQFRLAMHIPGKEEFHETLRYFSRRLELGGVKLHLGDAPTRRRSRRLRRGRRRHRRRAAHPVAPRRRPPEGRRLPAVIRERVPVGERVAVIGAGGIGFDVSEFLLHELRRVARALDGSAGASRPRGRRAAAWPPRSRRRRRAADPPAAAQDVRARQGPRQDDGWVHRTTLKDPGVEMVPGVTYDRIDDDGLHITVATGRRSRACSTSTRSCCAPARSRCAI